MSGQLKNYQLSPTLYTEMKNKSEIQFTPYFSMVSVGDRKSNKLLILYLHL